MHGRAVNRAMVDHSYYYFDLRHYPRVGDYYCTRAHPTRVVCRAYTAPPSIGGHFITDIERGTSLGPVEDWEESDDFITICVQGWWVNVWAAARGGVHYAFRYPNEEVESWRAAGWLDGGHN